MEAQRGEQRIAIGDVIQKGHAAHIQEARSGAPSDDRVGERHRDAVEYVAPIADGGGIAGDGAIDNGHPAVFVGDPAAFSSGRGIESDGGVVKSECADIEKASAVGAAEGGISRHQAVAYCDCAADIVNAAAAESAAGILIDPALGDGEDGSLVIDAAPSAADELPWITQLSINSGP